VPLTHDWVNVGSRLITPDGFATLIAWPPDMESLETELAEPVAGFSQMTYQPGEVALDSQFTLLRFVNLDVATRRAIEEIVEAAVLAWQALGRELDLPEELLSLIEKIKSSVLISHAVNYPSEAELREAIDFCPCLQHHGGVG